MPKMEAKQAPKVRPSMHISMFKLIRMILEQGYKAGNTNWVRRLSTIDLLIKVACLVKKYSVF